MLATASASKMVSKKKTSHHPPCSLAPKHLNCKAPPPTAKICKTMVDKGWLQKHPGIKLVDEGDWMTGFYSRVNKEELYEADVDHLRELDEYPKRQAQLEESI